MTNKNKRELIISILRDYRSPDTADPLSEMFRTYLQEHNIAPISFTFRFFSIRGITLGNHLFINDSNFVEIPVIELKNAGYEETLTWRVDDMSLSKMIFLNFVKEYSEKLC